MPVVRGEDEGGTWRDDGVLEVLVVVHAQRGDEIESVAEPRSRLQISAHLGGLVDVLVPAGDRAPRNGVGLGVVVTDDRVDPIAEREVVLELGGEQRGLVHDGIARSQHVGIACVAAVPEHLCEEGSLAQPCLYELVLPVLGLSRPDTSHLDRVDELAEAVREDDVIVRVVPGAEVHPRFDAVPFGLGVSLPDDGARVRGCSSLLRGIAVAEVVTSEVLPGDLEADSLVVVGPCLAGDALEEPAATARDTEGGSLFVEG